MHFKVKHLGLAKTRGGFTSFEGTVEVGEDPIDTRVDAASVNTDDEARDNHLHSADFFDVEHHPHLTFRSTGVRRGAPTRCWGRARRRADPFLRSPFTSSRRRSWTSPASLMP